MAYIIFEESGHKRKGEFFNCCSCKQQFIRRLNSTKKYCSRDCLNNAPRDKVELECFNCKNKISRTPSEIKASKHGVHFCSRKCKEFAQSLKGNCLQIRPEHYGTANGCWNYRAVALKHYGENCSVCGYNIPQVLQVHHKDGDRSNNDISNLDVLCPTHHIEYHVGILQY